MWMNVTLTNLVSMELRVLTSLEVIAALVRLDILEKTAEKVLFSTCLNISDV